jgi:hypothetical protein
MENRNTFGEFNAVRLYASVLVTDIAYEVNVRK